MKHFLFRLHVSNENIGYNRALAVPYILFLHYFIVLQFGLLKMLLAGVPGVTRAKKIFISFSLSPGYPWVF